MKKEGRILVVDDNKDILESLVQLLKYDFELIKTIKNPNQLTSLLKMEDFDVVLLDMNFKAGLNSGNEGLFWLDVILKINPEIIVILITAYGDIELSVKGIKRGAHDFIVKPWNPDKLFLTIKSAVEIVRSRKKIAKLESSQSALKDQIGQDVSLYGKSAAMQKVLETIKKVAGTDANILIQGENGTGKEVVARQIHRMSLRANEMFVPIDLGALSESLFETELFGHVKGAYTDAKESRAGRIEQANGGTLFLDEIGNIPLSMQSKLLTVLERRVVSKVGCSKEIPINVRLVAATNSNLCEMVKEKKFREDLLYRINTLAINLPPLRERGEDIIEFARTFLKKYAKKYLKKDLVFSEDVYKYILEYPWPGNIRELKHSIERAVILSEGKTITMDAIEPSSSSNTEMYANSLRLDDIEKQAITNALKKGAGNLSKAARILAISRTTLYSKMKKHGL